MVGPLKKVLCGCGFLVLGDGWCRLCLGERYNGGLSCFPSAHLVPSFPINVIALMAQFPTLQEVLSAPRSAYPPPASSRKSILIE